MAQNTGDYGSAVTYYEEAVCAYPGDEGAVDTACIALRQLLISQFLINRFLSDFGLARDEYRGFAQLGHQFEPDSVSDRLLKLVNSVPESSAVSVSMNSSLQMDQFIKTGWLEIDSDISSNGKSVFGGRTCFLIGLSALQRKLPQIAINCFASLIADNPLCSSAYLLLGQMYYRQGLGRLALSNMNLAILHPGDYWFDTGHSALDPVGLGEYKGYAMVFCRSEYHAIPTAGDFFFRSVDGHNVLYHNCVASHIRRMLLQILPKRVVSMLRLIVHATPLRLVMLRPVSLSGFLHGKDLMTVITAIEQSRQTADERGRHSMNVRSLGDRQTSQSSS